MGNAIIVMSNGDAYHTTTNTANQLLHEQTPPPPQTPPPTYTFTDTRSGKLVTIIINQVSSVVRDGDA